jgi:thiamine biosynthesis lipoprotein
MGLKRLLVIAISLCVGCSAATHTAVPPQEPYKASEIRYVMGTLLDITLFAPSQQEGRALLKETFQIAEHLDSVLSTWKPESPVSVFNRDPSPHLRQVDPDLYALVTRSQELSARTDGAFTIGVRPLVEMWENAAKAGAPPSARAIADVERLIMPANLLTSPPFNLGKRFPEVRIETGGIGKGYAVDRMVSFLRSRGVGQAFINFGRSSIAAIGKPPGASGWRMEVALSDTSSEGIIELHDETLSVSRARGTPFVINGVAYAHIFDPRTGMPVKAARGAAVRGPSATDGEAFVKYLIIRGAPSAPVADDWGGVGWVVRTDNAVEMSRGFGINKGEIQGTPSMTGVEGHGKRTPSSIKAAL